MLTIVIGGSGSGKSEYAETLAVNSASASLGLYYLATMQPFDLESKERILRHQQMRAGKGFLTVECPSNLMQMVLPDPLESDRNSSHPHGTILLECLSNLVANEMYSESGAHAHTYEAIQKGILHLLIQAEQVIIVTNNVFEDGILYDEETRRYLATLGQLNCWLCQIADSCIEVVHGIPLPIKKGASICNPYYPA